jgi:hypothetical protein
MSMFMAGSNSCNLTGLILLYITLEFGGGYAFLGMKTRFFPDSPACLGMDAFASR